MGVIAYIFLLALSGLVVGALARLLLSVICAMGIVYAVRKYRQRTAPPRTAEPFTFGQRNNVHTRVYFFPGCLVFSLLASLVLTILLNLIVRAF